MSRPPLCATCRGSRTTHTGDPDGCWCRTCLRTGERCQRYVPDEEPPPPRTTPAMRDRAEAIAALREGSTKKRAFRLWQVRGAEGYTDEEIADVLARPLLQVVEIREELVHDGLVRETPDRRPNRYGLPLPVFTLNS